MNNQNNEKKHEAFAALSVAADLWRLATAIYLVEDITGPLLTRDEMFDSFELAAIYQLAEGSIRANVLKGEFDERIDDYWVQPDDFLRWCIQKKIRLQSEAVMFYKGEVLPESLNPFVSGERDLQPKQEDRERTLAIVSLKKHHDPNISMKELLEDKDVLEFGRAKGYSSSVVKGWILKEFPAMKGSPGRPRKS